MVDATERREVFVFIHGYNTSFEGAAIRTAQLAVDMNLDGAPILYSWPSRASLLGYAADTDTAADEVLIQDVADFLTDVAGRTGAERVHLVAHSMGNRFLVRALDRIASRADRVRFDEVVMAAPDVAVDEFQDTWPRIMNTGERFTLYASRRDRALQISARINGMHRIGDAREVVVNTGLQTVDTTAASAGLLGHDDFAGSALADFRAVMWLSLAPDQRCVLETAEDDGRRYWAFGGQCPEQDFGDVTQMVRANGSVEAALSKLETDMISVGVAARQELGRKRDLLRALFTQAASPAGAP
ncbi:alpha/beta hydrolase [Brevundimonas denitrificans]|uniref:alpha/beta hydrolase n=1 Tax=Brevundimonas denitrificans TaxID=1443434 RepID=UPI00223C43C4|nr:alpha/beta hydrolase [Brevundimonas denitrificans]